MAEQYPFGNGGSPLAMVWMATRKNNDDYLVRKAGFGTQEVAVWVSLR